MMPEVFVVSVLPLVPSVELELSELVSELLESASVDESVLPDVSVLVSVLESTALVSTLIEVPSSEIFAALVSS